MKIPLLNDFAVMLSVYTKLISSSKIKEITIQELKDLCVNPLNHKEMVTATKDSVFISKDAGCTWNNLGSMSNTTPGVKAVAVATIQGETVVFMSHPIFGLSYIFPDKQKATWNDVDAGFEKMHSFSLFLRLSYNCL